MKKIGTKLIQGEVFTVYDTTSSTKKTIPTYLASLSPQEQKERAEAYNQIPHLKCIVDSFDNNMTEEETQLAVHQAMFKKIYVPYFK